MHFTAPNSKSGQATIIELHFEDEDGKVRVVPADHDLLLMSVNDAVDACRAYRDQIVFNDQYHLLLDRLWRWIGQRRSQIAHAFLTARDEGILFLVVGSSKTYCAELEDALTQLDIDIANDDDLSLIRMSVHALPNCTHDEARSFLSRKFALQFPVDGK